jgi:hypothetical protein
MKRCFPLGPPRGCIKRISEGIWSRQWKMIERRWQRDSWQLQQIIGLRVLELAVGRWRRNRETSVKLKVWLWRKYFMYVIVRDISSVQLETDCYTFCVKISYQKTTSGECNRAVGIRCQWIQSFNPSIPSNNHALLYVTIWRSSDATVTSEIISFVQLI